jgi:putative hydroxymethylpyrimidine transport system substrate-binding protein
MPWVVAQEKGFYSDAGLDVKFVFPATPSDPIKYVSTGNAQITATYTPDVLAAASEGLGNFKVVYSIMDQDCGGIIALDDSGIKSPADLKGKTVAIYDIPMTQLHFATMIKTYGLTEKDVNKVSAGDYSAPLMITGKVDAADGAGPSEQVTVASELKKKVNIFYYDKSAGVPDRYWLVMAVNSEFADKNPQAVKDFIKATQKGLEYSAAHPEEAVDIFVKTFPDMDKTVIAEAFQSLMDRSYVRFDETATPGYMNLDYWNDYQDFFYNNKLLSQKVVVEDIVTDDYLE